MFKTMPSSRKRSAAAFMLALALGVPAATTLPSALAAPGDVQVSITPANEVVAYTPITMNWSYQVPASAKPGDSFIIETPPELYDFPDTHTDLKDPDGNVIANMHVQGDGKVTVTYTTNYIATHQDVVLKGFIEALVGDSIQPNETRELVWVVDGQTVRTTITMDECGVSCEIGTQLAKNAWFEDDQGLTGVSRVEVPAQKGVLYTVTDRLTSPGQEMDCDTPVGAGWYHEKESWGAAKIVDAAQVIEVSCSPTERTVQVSWTDSQDYPRVVINSFFPWKVTNTNLASYTDTAIVSAPTGERDETAYSIRRYGAGGEGEGNLWRVSVGDYVWEDTNKDGVQNEGEPGIPDVTLTLTGPNGETVTDLNGNTVVPVKTNTNGKYSFDNLPVLPAGEHYTVTITAPEGYTATTPGAGGDRATDSSTGSAESIDLTTDGARDDTLDFGFIKNPPAQVSVGDYVFYDNNRDGIQNEGDTPVVGATLSITQTNGQPVLDVNGQPVRPITTGEDGKYSFDNLPVLPAGEHYIVSITNTPEGWVPTTPGAGGDRATDSSTGSAESIDLTTDGARDDTLDFGFIQVLPAPPAKVSVGDYVFYDNNRDGIQNAGDTPVAGATLSITQTNGQPVLDVEGNPVQSITTGEDGKYSFENLPILPAGEHYIVSITNTPEGWVPTTPGAGGDRATDSSTERAESTDLITDGARDDTLDFGFMREEEPTPTPTEPTPTPTEPTPTPTEPTPTPTTPAPTPTEPTTPPVTTPPTTTPPAPKPSTPPTTKPSQPSPKMVTRRFQVDTEIVKGSRWFGQKIAEADDDGRLYRGELANMVWKTKAAKKHVTEKAEFVTVTLPANATTAQWIAGINKATKYGDITSTNKVGQVTTMDSTHVYAWELPADATFKVTKANSPFGKQKYQVFFGSK